MSQGVKQRNPFPFIRLRHSSLFSLLPIEPEKQKNIQVIVFGLVSLLPKISQIRPFFLYKLLFLHNEPNRSNSRFPFLCTEKGVWGSLFKSATIRTGGCRCPWRNSRYNSRRFQPAPPFQGGSPISGAAFLFDLPVILKFNPGMNVKK